MSSELELRAKLAAKKGKVRDAIKGIVKTGQNQAQHYKYAEECEVVLAVRGAFLVAGIDFSVSVTGFTKTHDIPTKSGSMGHFVINMTCTLTDTETGYSEVSPWIGAGADSGDKAINKCMTSGVKYFLMKTLLLPTGDDLEAFEEVDQPPKKGEKKPPAQQQKKKPTTPEEITTAAFEQFAGEHAFDVPEGYEWSEKKFIAAVKALNKGNLLQRVESIPKVLEVVKPEECWSIKSQAA